MPITWRGKVNRLVGSFLGQSTALGPDLPTIHGKCDISEEKAQTYGCPFESGSSRAMQLHLHPAICVSELESLWPQLVLPHFRGPRSS